MPAGKGRGNPRDSLRLFLELGIISSKYKHQKRSRLILGSQNKERANMMDIIKEFLGKSLPNFGYVIDMNS